MIASPSLEVNFPAGWRRSSIALTSKGHSDTVNQFESIGVDTFLGLQRRTDNIWSDAWHRVKISLWKCRYQGLADSGGRGCRVRRTEECC